MRKPRELVCNARYHVVARANRKEMILDSSGNKALFLDVLARAKRRYVFSIEHFCLMGNHFHLIIKPARHVNLSRLMQWIMSVFAQAFNRLYNLTGHVWGERFFSRVIGSLREYAALVEYIDENPVKAGLVEHPLDWIFGGLHFRRQGWGKLIDPLPPYLSFLLPAHSVLLLERSC